MRKIKYILMAFLASIALATPSFATSEGQTRANGDVSIVSIDEVSRTDGVIVNSDPTFEGLNMSFNVSLVNRTDRIEYEVTIQNSTDTDYIISEEAAFAPNDYLTYNYQVDNPDLKAHSESKVRIAVEYTSEIPDAEFASGVYANRNQAVIKLLNKDGSEVNPNTYDASSSKYIAVIIVCAVLVLAVLLLFTKKRGRAKVGLFALVIALSALPLLSFAVETIELTINAEVSIKRTYEVAYQLDIDSSKAYIKVSDYDLSQASCADIIYLGEVSEANKYQRCNSMIAKDRSYVIGETVETKVILIDYISSRYNNNCTQLNDNEMLCAQDDVDFYQDQASVWGYQHINDGPYATNDDDVDIMNLSNVWYDTWASGGMQIFDSPNTFTMPAHSVLFFQHKVQ